MELLTLFLKETMKHLAQMSASLMSIDNTLKAIAVAPPDKPGKPKSAITKKQPTPKPKGRTKKYATNAEAAQQDIDDVEQGPKEGLVSIEEFTDFIKAWAAQNTYQVTVDVIKDFTRPNWAPSPECPRPRIADIDPSKYEACMLALKAKEDELNKQPDDLI